MKKTKFGVGVLLIATLMLGLWLPVSAENDNENDKNKGSKPKSNNLVNVYSCIQVGDTIQITLKKNYPVMTLKAGCSDAGYGQRNYAFTCVSEKKYKVEWEACPLLPRISQLQIKNSTTGKIMGTANSSYVTLGSKFAAKQMVNVAPTVEALQLNLLTKNTVSNGNYTYAFAWADASSTINFDESLAKTLATSAGFNSSSLSNLLLTDYYRGKNITVVAFMRNNDGVSKVPGMPVEVDDVIAIHLKAKSKPPVLVCNDQNGGDGTYTLCLNKTFTYSMSNITVNYSTELLNRVGLTISGMQFVVGEGQGLSLLAADKKTVLNIRVHDINRAANTVKIKFATQSLLPTIIQ